MCCSSPAVRRTEQLWRMNIDGGDVEMLTTGEGDVANPAWSPNGQIVAFAWTRGYEPAASIFSSWTSPSRRRFKSADPRHRTQ